MRKLSGMDDIVMSCHFKDAYVNRKADKKAVRHSLAALANLIEVYKVRFVLGDFNMACYRIVPELS